MDDPRPSRGAATQLIDPDLHALFEALPVFDLTREALPEIRRAARAARPPAADPGGVSLTRRIIPGPPGAPDVAIFIYRPDDASGVLPAMLHFHGGGYVLGFPEMADARIRPLARAADCMIVSVQYRLAPEHRFPAALHDGYAALQWVHAHAPDLGIDPARIALGGESAGGHLAASLAQLARDRGQVPVIFQLLTYPMLDNRSGRCLPRGPHTGTFDWTPERVGFCWDALLGEGHGLMPPPPYAVPGRCENLAGLPPAFIGVGDLDLFAEEDIDYARRLVHAGVPTELHLYPGAFHGFDLAAGAWATESFLAHRAAALHRGLHRGLRRGVQPTATATLAPRQSPAT